MQLSTTIINRSLEGTSPVKLLAFFKRFGVATFLVAALSVVVLHPKTGNAGPVARPATADELAIFAQWAPTNSGAWTIIEYAVAPPFALVGYSDANSGVTVLLKQDASGQWALVKGGGGQFIPETMQRWVPDLPSDTAQSLYSLAVSQNQ